MVRLIKSYDKQVYRLLRHVRLVYDHKLGGFRRSTRLEDLGHWIRNEALRATRVFRTRYVVYHLDCAKGVVSFRKERWSWRRWRWEVV